MVASDRGFLTLLRRFCSILSSLAHALFGFQTSIVNTARQDFRTANADIPFRDPLSHPKTGILNAKIHPRLREDSEKLFAIYDALFVLKDLVLTYFLWLFGSRLPGNNIIKKYHITCKYFLRKSNSIQNALQFCMTS